MSEFSKKLSYIKGLADGAGLDAKDKLADILLKLIDATNELARGVDELNDAHDELNDYVENIDEDLFKLEERDRDDDDDDDFFDFDDDDETENAVEKAELHPFPIKPEDVGRAIVHVCPRCLKAYRVSEEAYLDDADGFCPHCGEQVSARDDAESEALPEFRVKE